MKSRLQEAEIFVKLAKKFPGIIEISGGYCIYCTTQDFNKMVEYAKKKLNIKILGLGTMTMEENYKYLQIV